MSRAALRRLGDSDQTRSIFAHRDLDHFQYHSKPSQGSFLLGVDVLSSIEESLEWGEIVLLGFAGVLMGSG